MAYDKCSDGWCGACTRCYPQQLEEREAADRECQSMALRYDHIVKGMERLDAMPCEEQSYQDLVWYDWAVDKSEELYEWLIDMLSQYDPPEWEQGHD